MKFLFRRKMRGSWIQLKGKDAYQAIGMHVGYEPDVIDDKGSCWIDNQRMGQVRIVK